MRQQLFLPSAVIAAVAVVSAFGFAFGFASANSESANVFAPNAVLEGNKYPIVLVHGFAGWGRDELLGVKHWGGFQGDLQEQLKAQGHTVFTASVGPFSSNWDRACELYAQIKGTTVDFGATHSKHFDHARLGHTYSQGLYPQWGDVDPTTGGINKIHLIGYSMGGTTIRMLAQMLVHGSAGAPWGQEANASRESLFAGGKDWVHSITTISSPHLGTTIADAVSTLGGDTLKHVFFGIFAAFGVVGNSTEHFYDVKMDQWGIDAKGEHESLYQYVDRVLSSDLFTKPGCQDTGIWSCSTQGAAEENMWVRTLPNIYYMSYATSDTFATRDFLRRPTQLPHMLTMMLPLQPLASFMGSQYPIRHGFSTEWQENDGVVPTISMAKDATGDSVVVANETTGFSKIVRGKWNIMPKLDRLDHAAVMGFTLHKQISGIYLRHVELLRSLPKEDAVVAVAIPGGAQVRVPPLAQPLVQPLTARMGANEKLQQCGDPYLLMASTASSHQHIVEMTTAVERKARKQQRNPLFSAAPVCTRHEPKLKEELSLATASASGRARKKDASVGVVMGPYRRRGESNSSYTKALGDIVVHPRRVAGSVETTFVGSRGNPGPGGTGSIIVRVHKDSHTASLIWAASMAYSRKDTTNNFAEYWGLMHGLREAQRSHFEPLYVIGDSVLIISQQRMHRTPRQHRLARLYQTSRRLADCIDIRGWYHHYRAFNKMADSAANLAMDTRTSTQVHFPTHRAAFNNLTQDLDNDVMHWLMRSSEDPRSLDNTRQPHIGPREHAILVKDYLAFRSDLLQPAL
ncbi:Lish domain-containing protein, partial [Globisporangium splendens]